MSRTKVQPLHQRRTKSPV